MDHLTTHQLIGTGIQDCTDMHFWGPGVRQCYIIHLVLHGAGYLEVGQKKYRMEEGQSFIIYPNTTILYYPDETDPWTYTWVDFIHTETNETSSEIFLGDKEPVCRKQLGDSLRPLFERLQTLHYLQDNRHEAAGILATILGIYQDAYREEHIQYETRVDERLQTAFTAIKANYYKPEFNVGTLCELLNVSRVTLYRIFQNSLHMAPNQYILQYRIEQSMKMLELGSKVKAASLSCGFTDPFYFSRVFKKRTGCSPSEFSKKYE